MIANGGSALPTRDKRPVVKPLSLANGYWGSGLVLALPLPVLLPLGSPSAGIFLGRPPAVPVPGLRLVCMRASALPLSVMSLPVSVEPAGLEGPLLAGGLALSLVTGGGVPFGLPVD